MKNANSLKITLPLTLALGLLALDSAQAQPRGGEKSPCETVYQESAAAMTEGAKQARRGEESDHSQKVATAADALKKEFDACRSAEDRIMQAHQQGDNAAMQEAQSEAEASMNSMRSLAEGPKQGEGPSRDFSGASRPNPGAKKNSLGNKPTAF